MTITYRSEFLDTYYNSSDKNIRLYLSKLGLRYENNTLEEELERVKTENSEELLKDSEPTLGYYEFSGILSSSDVFQISLEPKSSDLSVELYKNIYVLYEDSETSETGLAFIISLSDSEALRRTVNIIDIPEFRPICKTELLRTTDIDKLEGPGQGRYENVWGKGELASYITLSSWESYNQVFRCTDSELDHLDTVYIDEYGFKIY